MNMILWMWINLIVDAYHRSTLVDENLLFTLRSLTFTRIVLRMQRRSRSRKRSALKSLQISHIAKFLNVQQIEAGVGNFCKSGVKKSKLYLLTLSLLSTVSLMQDTKWAPNFYVSWCSGTICSIIVTPQSPSYYFQGVVHCEFSNVKYDPFSVAQSSSWSRSCYP